jgi:hypothetical protein
MNSQSVVVFSSESDSELNRTFGIFGSPVDLLNLKISCPLDLLQKERKFTNIK